MARFPQELQICPKINNNDLRKQLAIKQPCENVTLILSYAKISTRKYDKDFLTSFNEMTDKMTFIVVKSMLDYLQKI